MNDTIIVYYRGSMLIVFTETAYEFGLRNGQTIIDTDLFWQIIAHNASTGLAKIAIERAKQNVR